jgi:hypothetical protein
MSKGLGYVKRAIIELIESSGPEDVGWTIGWLCEHIYGENSTRSRRAALIRAIKTMKLPVGWKFEPGWDELQLINDERFYARTRSRHKESDGGVNGHRLNHGDVFCQAVVRLQQQRTRRGDIFVETGSI